MRKKESKREKERKKTKSDRMKENGSANRKQPKS